MVEEIIQIQQKLQCLGVSLQCTTSAAPVQFEGEVEGLHLYFRARGNYWDCAIAPTLDEAVAEDNLLYYKQESYGEDDFEASWMPHGEALEIILKCVQEFKSSR